MSRLVALVIVCGFLVSCDSGKKPATGGESGLKTEAAKVPPSAPKASSETTAGNLEKAVAGKEGEGKAVVASAKEVVAEVSDLAAVAESSFTVEKLKQAITSLNSEKLKELGDKLVAAIQNKDELIKGLKDQVSKLSLTDLKKSGNVEAATTVLKELKAKLAVVVDKLKGSGADVSKFNPFLKN